MLIDAANLQQTMGDMRKAKAADRPCRVIRDQGLSKKRA
jgi:hypothetical protein